MTTVFSSHPTDRFKLGRFQFEKGTLRLDDADADEFRELLDKQPGFIKSQVRELSVDAANKLAEKFQSGRKVTGVDTTRNSIAAPQPQKDGLPIDPVSPGEIIKDGIDADVKGVPPVDPYATVEGRVGDAGVHTDDRSYFR